MTNPRIGQSFDDFLQDEGMYEDVKTEALTNVIAWLNNAIASKSLTKTELAARMGTSRSQVDRLLNNVDDDIRLSTIIRAANAVGMSVEINLVER